MRPYNYILRDGCHNCRNTFVKSEWEEPAAYYCTLGDSDEPRPLCGSVYMKEGFFDAGRDDFESLSSAWEKWSWDRAVAEHGNCEAWRKSR